MNIIHKKTILKTLHHMLVLVCMLVSYPACEQGRRDEDHSVKIKIDSGALILDVRTPGEYQSWHFPGAVNVPLQQLEYRLRELGDLERPIIAYCTIGTRSHYAAMLLRSHGFRNVLNGGGLREMKQFERN